MLTNFPNSIFEPKLKVKNFKNKPPLLRLSISAKVLSIHFALKVLENRELEAPHIQYILVFKLILILDHLVLFTKKKVLLTL